MLVSVPCLFGAPVCAARTSTEVIAALQPCTDRAPNGSARVIGPIRDLVDEIHDGIVLLSVPVVDDVIQVGAGGALLIRTIEVVKSPTAMVVRRTDGVALQAEILHQRDGEPRSECRCSVRRWKRCSFGAGRTQPALAAGRCTPAHTFAGQSTSIN